MTRIVATLLASAILLPAATSAQQQELYDYWRPQRDMIRHGLDPRAEQFDWEALRGGARARAEEELRASMLLETIAEREGIDVTDEEVEEEIRMIAEASRQTVEQVRAALTKQGGATSIADSLRSRKAVDLLVEKANVSEEEWREEEQESGVSSQKSE